MRLAAALAVGSLWASAASAQTTTYTYDALGRLKTSEVTGGPKTTIDYDAAGNRTSYNVSNAPAGADGNDPSSRDGAASPARTMFIVVPLNGYTVIPITRM